MAALLITVLPMQDRLHRLYLLELPLLLRWAVQAVLPLLHPVTRDKMQLSSIEDPDLPVTVAYLTKRCVLEMEAVRGPAREGSEWGWVCFVVPCRCASAFFCRTEWTQVWSGLCLGYSRVCSWTAK